MEGTEKVSGAPNVSSAPAQLNVFDRILDFGGRAPVSSRGATAAHTSLNNSSSPSQRAPKANQSVQSAEGVAKSLFDRTLDFGGNLEAAPKTVALPPVSEKVSVLRACGKPLVCDKWHFFPFSWHFHGFCLSTFLLLNFDRYCLPLCAAIVNVMR